MGVLSLLLGGSGVFPVIYDNFVRFRQVCLSVALYIYSIEEPGPMGDTGCAAWGLADPLPFSLSFSSSSFFQRGRGVGGEGGMVGICCKHVALSPCCPA